MEPEQHCADKTSFTELTVKTFINTLFFFSYSRNVGDGLPEPVKYKYFSKIMEADRWDYTST